jgi:DNA-binding NtrC family response regulator
MSASPISVLVIDDNADLAENIGEILEDVGVDVHLARDADAALEAFDRRSWSLVVTDVRMPGVDGIELLSLIKERSPGTPVLVMTGYADRDTVTRAHESGALAVVNKPLDLDALINLIERVAEAEKPVLVVEDDVALVGNLTDILCEERGVLPHPATSVALARKLAASIDFEVALIDLRLPDGDGLALARELLHRDDGTPRSVIIMTGYPEQLDELREAVGESDDLDSKLVVLTKPFPVPRLIERLREMV